MSWLDPNDQNPATNQSVWGTHSGSVQAFYADATPFNFDVNNSDLSLVINATISTN